MCYGFRTDELIYGREEIVKAMDELSEWLSSPTKVVADIEKDIVSGDCENLWFDKESCTLQWADRGTFCKVEEPLMITSDEDLGLMVVLTIDDLHIVLTKAGC